MSRQEGHPKEEPCLHFIAYVEMIGAMHRGYEKAHGDDDCCRESFANALVFLLVDHIQEHRMEDRPLMLESYKKELALALMPEDECAPPAKAQH